MEHITWSFKHQEPLIPRHPYCFSFSFFVFGMKERKRERGHSYLIGILSAFVFNQEVCFVCILSLFPLFVFFSMHFTKSGFKCEWQPDHSAPLLNLALWWLGNTATPSFQFIDTQLRSLLILENSVLCTRELFKTVHHWILLLFIVATENSLWLVIKLLE